jgi:hypothetical protein
LYLLLFAKSGLPNADAVVTCLARSKSVLDLRNANRRFVEAIAKVLEKRINKAEREVYRRQVSGTRGGRRPNLNGDILG